jgi:hypothetical protein
MHVYIHPYASDAAYYIHMYVYVIHTYVLYTLPIYDTYIFIMYIHMRRMRRHPDNVYCIRCVCVCVCVCVLSTHILG